MGWLRVSLKHPYTNFRKTVYPKKSLDAVLILQKTVWVFSHKYPSRHLPTQSEQQTHYNKVWNKFKVSNKDTRPDVFIVNFKHISQLVLVFLLLT